MRGFTLQSEEISQCLSPDVLIDFLEKLRNMDSAETKVKHWNIRVNTTHDVSSSELMKSYRLANLNKRYLLKGIQILT